MTLKRSSCSHHLMGNITCLLCVWLLVLLCIEKSQLMWFCIVLLGGAPQNVLKGPGLGKPQDSPGGTGEVSGKGMSVLIFLVQVLYDLTPNKWKKMDWWVEDPVPCSSASFQQPTHVILLFSALGIELVTTSSLESQQTEQLPFTSKIKLTLKYLISPIADVLSHFSATKDFYFYVLKKPSVLFLWTSFAPATPDLWKSQISKLSGFICLFKQSLLIDWAQ